MFSSKSWRLKCTLRKNFRNELISWYELSCPQRISSVAVYFPSPSETNATGVWTFLF